MNWPWRKKAPVPRYIDAVALLNWAQRYADMDDLPEPVRRCYRHMVTQVGRMEWQR